MPEPEEDQTAQEELPGIPEEDAVDKAIDWLERRWGMHRECPYCHASNWIVNAPVYFAAAGTKEGVTTGRSPELFLVTCTNCGHVVFVDRALAEEWEEDQRNIAAAEAASDGSSGDGGNEDGEAE